MKKLLPFLLLLAGLPAFAQSRAGGRAIASAYSGWSARLVAAVDPGVAILTLDNCIFQVPGGRDIFPISTNTPLTIAGDNPETVTPSAVSKPVVSTGGGSNGFTCSATATVTSSHAAGSYVSFGDGGAGAAVNDLGSGIVVLDNTWGSALAITSLPAGNANVSLSDERTGPAHNYCWGGSSYGLCSTGVGLTDPGSNGVLKRFGLNATSLAAASDISALWTGTCNSLSFLRGDGACQTPIGNALTSNPLSQFGSTTSLQLGNVLSNETGTGSVVFSNSPILITPSIGLATGDITGNAGTATRLAANGTNCPGGQAALGVDALGNAEGCFTPAGGGDALTVNPLSQFAATSSLQLKTNITDETGSGALVFANTPALVTPDIGTATGTSIALGGGTALTTTNRTGTGNLVLATSPSLTTPNIGAATASALTLSAITGSTQCLHVNTSGVVSGTASDCGAGGGGGGVTTVSGTAGQITVVNGTTTPTISVPATFTFPGTVTNDLSIFGSTTSAVLATLLSNETGTGVAVFSASPTFTGVPLAPTAALSTNTTQLATTAFVLANAGGGLSGLTTGYIPKSTSATTLGNSLLDDGITTANYLTYAGTGFKTTGFTGASYIGLSAGDGSDPGVTAGQVGMVSPFAGITAYDWSPPPVKTPIASGSGYMKFTDIGGSNLTSVFETGVSSIANNAVDNAQLASGAVTDDKASLLDKPAVTLVAVANVTLSGFTALDSVTPADGTLILATAQSTGAQNGPWVAHSGAWTRPVWYASGSTTQAPQFLTTQVRLGTLYTGSWWRMTTAAVTIDTTTTTWTETPLARVNGVNYPASPATHSIPIVTASTTASAKVIPDCADTGGNHLNFSQSGDSITCGTSGGGGAGSGVGRYSGAIDFPSIPDGTCNAQTMTATGVGTGDVVSPGWPSALNAGLLGNMFVSATNTLTVNLCNHSGAAIDPISLSYSAVLAVYNLNGSSAIDFASIPDGGYLASTFALTGVVAGDPVVAGWPSALPAGLAGSMVATATDTIEVRLFNFSGAAVDPASLTYKASIAK